MKNFKILLMALVAMCGLNSCSDDCNHDFIEHDFSQELVGTWTYVNGEQAEAMVIKADGSFTTTGVMNGGNGEFYEEKGTIKVVNNKVTLAFDGDNESYEGRLEFVAGKSMSIVMFDDNDVRLDYDYCENDLSDEIVGMWVCSNSFANTENDMLIQTFKEDGTSITTGYISDMEDFVTNAGGNTYKVIGNLFINILPDHAVAAGVPPYMAMRLDYTPNGTANGDIMTFTHYLADGTKNTDTFLRVKQSLDLAGKKYDYNNTYVSNVKGLDEDMTMMGYTFNIGKMEGKNLDKMLKTLLFAVEFPNANTLKYQYHYNGQNIAFEVPIVVDGNKVTIQMSEMYPYYRDVDMYMFQDQDACQLHMYMPTYSFINYFGNMDVAALAFAGEIDVNDAAAVEAIFERMDERVESINVSFTFKATK
ncbi:MAG: hypothetical protein J6Q43_01005 [Bacteroidaceae bacterium]|nr:hypothetical protein [Bacteroidaceae bacterium]